MIARSLVRECAVVTAQEQTLGEPLPASFRLDLTRKVYAEYLEVEGVNYIKNLSNTKPKSARTELLLDAQKTGPVCQLLIAQDHLGVRAVQFAGSAGGAFEAELTPGAWYKDMSMPDGFAGVWVKTDVREADCLHLHAPYVDIFLHLDGQSQRYYCLRPQFG